MSTSQRPSESSAEESGELERIKLERDALQQERDNLFDRLARATAEFQNARRRLEGDKEAAVAFANSSLITSLLPVIDNFERALSVDPAKADAATILKGMQIVHDQWMTVLKSQFVETIAPQPGTPFDPATMQALIHQDNDKYPENTVTQLLQNGYALHGRTLRPAQVAVSKSAK
ncbi:MAG: nucleotide exchange factor GrpE [Tepidisphaeraceae bacterium]|jgi:molecular chaperone GrpE